MRDEDPIIVWRDSMPVGFEPVIIAEKDRERMFGEYWRHRHRISLVLVDNQDGTLGLWVKRETFWVGEAFPAESKQEPES
jgi:hypothetical protein